MRITSTTLILLALLGLSAAAQADAGRTTERDECISNLRGLAEINASKQGFTIVKLDQGEYATEADGSVSCKAQFQIVKDGKASFSQVFSGQVAKQSK